MVYFVDERNLPKSYKVARLVPFSLPIVPFPVSHRVFFSVVFLLVDCRWIGSNQRTFPLHGVNPEVR